MFIKIIYIVALLKITLSEDEEALPKMSPMKKNSKYGDDVCSYTLNNHKYVRHCEKGKFCADQTIDTLEEDPRGEFFEESKIEICQDLPSITPLYKYSESSCTTDFECENDYQCIDGVCTEKCDTGEFYSSYGCKDNSYKGSDGICKETTIKKDESIPDKFSSYDPNKECGKYILADNPNDNKKGIYYINKYEYVYEGEVEDGEYVQNKKYCKSGFALYFFKDGKSKDPRDSNAVGYNTMYLRCVTPISVNKISNNECVINYKINENAEIFRYNVKQLNTLSNDNTKYTEINSFCNGNNAKYIKIKYEKYREYYTKMTEEERKTCGDLDVSNQYTCENNELIKSWYFYKNPEKFSAYNDRKKISKVVDYLIQKDYPCYSLSKILSIKFFYLLFLFLF